MLNVKVMTRNDSNIYNDALKYGVQHMSDGISLDELKTHLQALGYKIEGRHGDYFNYWFFSNFFYETAYTNIKNGNPANAQAIIKDSQHWNLIKCAITAEAYETHIDFEKLREARTSAIRAQKLSYIAIWISAGLAFIQIMLQIVSLLSENNHFCFYCLFE